ncbi:MAG: hypothetical protein JNM57_14705 [Cyclobacteriaceae bacterium]|nr:hypothetical protein [Cyclobacteriaceae bacterium]
MKTIIVEVPDPFESFFGNFTKYGIGDRKIPYDLDKRAREFIIDHIVKHESKLGFKRDKMNGPKLIDELARLTFAFQFFAEVRLNITPKFEDVGILSKHPDFISLKNELSKSKTIISFKNYTKYKEDLAEISGTWSVLSAINEEFDSTSVLQNIEIKLELNPRLKRNSKLKTIRLPQIMWREFLRTTHNLALNSMTNLQAYKNIANRGNKANDLLIQLLRGAMISYLRERIYKEKDHPSSKISKAEAFLVGVVLAAGGFLMGPKTHPITHGKLWY